MKKTKFVSILMIAIMILAIIVPTTRVLAVDEEVNTSGLFGFSGEDTNIAKDALRTYMKVGASGTLVPVSLDEATKTYFQEGKLMDDAYITSVVRSGEDLYPDITDYTVAEDKLHIIFNQPGQFGVYISFSAGEYKIEIPVYVLSEEEWNEKFNPTLTDPNTEEITSKLDNDVDMIVTYSTISTIDSEVFKTLQSKSNASLSINVGNITWKFNSDTITKTDSMFTPAVQISAEKFEHIKPEDITDGLFVEFAYDGQLPGKAEITIFVGVDKFGENEKELNLYYYNDIIAEYEDMGTAKYSNGNVTLVLDHCSTYVLTEQKLGTTETPETPTEEEPNKPEEENPSTPSTETDNVQEEPSTDNKKDDTPKTGVNNIYIIVASVLTVISIGIITFIRKIK